MTGEQDSAQKPVRLPPTTEHTNSPVSPTETTGVDLAERASSPGSAVQPASGEPSGAEPAPRPIWPPPQPMFRRRETLSTGKITLLTLLASVLVLSGLAFIISLTNGQYRTALHAQNAVNARSTADTRGTADAQVTGTAQVLATAQTNILATATAQGNSTAIATTQVGQVTATASALNDRLTQVTGGTPAFDDPLSDDTGNNGWDEGDPTAGTGCLFTNGDYQASSGQQGFLQPCIARSTNFSNFAYQVQMTVTRGDQAGLLFRASASQNTYYIFRIGLNGDFALDLYKASNKGVTLFNGFNAAISSGLNQSNTLSVLADHSTFYLYANQQYLGAVSDTTLSSGQIGVVAIDYTLPTEAEFTDAQAWQI